MDFFRAAGDWLTRISLSLHSGAHIPPFCFILIIDEPDFFFFSFCFFHFLFLEPCSSLLIVEYIVGNSEFWIDGRNRDFVGSI